MPQRYRSLNPSSYSDTCFRVSIPLGQWRTKTITGSASPKTEVHLTQGNQIPIVLQHHISVHDLLRSIQELPLLPGEVHKYILEGHQCLQHETSLHWPSCVSVLAFLNPDREFRQRALRKGKESVVFVLDSGQVLKDTYCPKTSSAML